MPTLNMEPVGVAKFAEIVKSKDTTIYDLVNKGVLKCIEDKNKILINPATQRRRYYYYRMIVGGDRNHKITDSLLTTINRMESSNEEYSKPSDEMELSFNKKANGNSYPASEDLGAVVEDHVMAMGKAKLRKEKAMARKAELEAEEKAGNLIKIDEIKSMWMDIGIRVQKAILAIPDRLGPILASESDAHKVHRMMTEELKYALRNLSMEIIDNGEDTDGN